MDSDENIMNGMLVFIVVLFVFGLYVGYHEVKNNENICIQNNMSKYGYSTCYNESDHELYQIIIVNETPRLLKTVP